MASLTSARSERVRWLFGRFELVPARGRLWSGGAEVSLAPKAFSILVHLVRHRDRIVSRDELLATGWVDTTVSDAAVASCIRDLRRALEDEATEPRFVATVRGQGWRFVHSVTELLDLGDDPGGAWDAAASHFERALAALTLVETGRGETSVVTGSGVPRQRAELMVALARARWSAGARDEARDAFLDAASVARRIGDSEILAQAALGFVGRSDVTPGVGRQGIGLLEEALAAVPVADSTLRAELLARMGTELYYDDDTSQCDRLTREALAMTDRLGDRMASAYASTARHFACQRPEVDPRTRIALADRAIALAREAPASDVLAFALQERMVDLFEIGDGRALEETLEEFGHVVEELDQPFFSWLYSMFRGTRALLEGDVDEAERLANETLQIGLRQRSPNAEGVFAGQIFSVRREQGRLAELAPILAAAAERHGSLPVFRAGRAAVAADAGSRQDANRALGEVMSRGLEDFPRDQNWIASLGTLTPPTIASGNEKRIRQLLAFLEPYAGRMIVVGQGATTHGAVSHHLGLLRAALGEKGAARAHLDDAEALHERARAQLWVDRSRRARFAL